MIEKLQMNVRVVTDTDPEQADNIHVQTNIELIRPPTFLDFAMALYGVESIKERLLKMMRDMDTTLYKTPDWRKP